ncbi:MAG: class I SAM-dependent methyltransferase [Candidatus Marinimicrobia bacterium]|jgi:2-polyprenyl-3-methyl-5-hydroxy-6-metoxy-1,4-benzoquinol methylase|nr:class I SAM-dependent methyltransferase [Candidatus Neomarinimicrobiota bacterium]MBT3634441.1 class I SAM-dependent methyltransferase [Candidatus Neomarinimicrobiota bacterium]MBT3683268.1 class I SAM-dependent methyltransferase [Candidatus Neomarinimicrobiota bacterium]MBT3760156.1 class I SAM-dependent methyltransferase [Candidatus Neomarinimicrobiota bacterium]MBT3896251.1 class I SAM-dependent methyltransferase [Candidatus Neomarinimicrobiota bacterium]
MEFVPCIVCGSDNYRLIKNLSDRLNPDSDNIFDLVQCECNFVYLNPRPDENEIRDYYKSPDYDPHSDARDNLFNKVYSAVRNLALRKKRQDISKYIHSGKLLDIGGGRGDFCLYMKSCGWDVSLMETDEDSIDLQGDTNINIYHKIENIPSTEYYDLITLWHSLEHIHDVKSLFGFLHSSLNDNGLCIIAVPNYNAYERRFYPETWAPYDAPRHLYHFCSDALRKLLEDNGFEILEIKPLLQDTPYNILLSQNSTSLLGYIKSAVQTIQSLVNIFAHGNTYASSLEIICRKV